MESKKVEMKNSEEIQDNNSILPFPEILKDCMIIFEFLLLFLFLFIAYLGRWRRNIIKKDKMTEDFEKLMERANQIKDE